MLKNVLNVFSIDHFHFHITVILIEGRQQQSRISTEVVPKWILLNQSQQSNGKTRIMCEICLKLTIKR